MDFATENRPGPVKWTGFRAACDRFNAVLDDFNLALFAALLVVASLQVLCRYVLRVPLPWTEELARFLVVWVTFLGSASVTRRKLHITVTFFAERFPPRTALVVRVVLYAMMFLFLLIIFWGTLVMFRSSWPVHAGTMPWLRMSWVYLGAIIGVMIMTILVLIHLTQEIRALRGSAGASAGA